MEEQKDFSRVEQMTDAELVRWKFILEQMAQIEARLAGLEANFSPGRRVPSQPVADALAAVKSELARRAREKGGEQEP